MSVAVSDRFDRSEGGAAGYDYRRDTTSAFDDAVCAVEAALARYGFAIVAMHDIQATLAAKGFDIKPIRIYEVNGPGDPFAGDALGGDAGERIARLMPCRINVFVEDESVAVTALRPTLLCRVFPEEDLGEVAAALERVLVAIVDEAAS